MNVGGPNDAISSSQARESDVLIVVMIPEKVKAGGAKGHYYKRSFKEYRPDRIDSNGSEKRWIGSTRRAV
jgi:hypothetical protein